MKKPLSDAINANGSKLDLTKFHPKIQQLFQGNKHKLRMIDDWVLMETLGIGGSSKVKLGLNKKNGQKAAIKIMFADQSGKIPQSKKKQLLRELNVMKKVNHPNIIKIINFNDNAKYPEPNGRKTPCIMTAFEFVAGGELFDYLMYTGHFDDIATRTYLKQLINGLEALHNAGIAHRDLKPENLLLDSSFTLKIADFGFSTEFIDSNTGKIKLMNTRCGTINYLAPEIWKGQPYSYKTDIFAVGIIFFTIFSGFPPFMKAEPNDWWWDKYSIALEKLKRANELRRFIKANESATTDALSVEKEEMNSCLLDARKRMQLFWKAHGKKRKFEDDDFKDIALNLIHPTPQKRMDIKDIMKHKWVTKGRCYNKEEAKEYLTKRVKNVLQGRAMKIRKLMQEQKKRVVIIKPKKNGERIDKGRDAEIEPEQDEPVELSVSELKLDGEQQERPQCLQLPQPQPSQIKYPDNIDATAPSKIAVNAHYGEPTIQIKVPPAPSPDAHKKQKYIANPSDHNEQKINGYVESKDDNDDDENMNNKQDINKGFVINIKGVKDELFVDSLFHFITYVSPVKMAAIIKRAANKNGGEICISPQDNSIVISCEFLEDGVIESRIKNVTTEKVVFCVQMYLLDDIAEDDHKRQLLSEREDVRYLVMFKRLKGRFDGYSKIARKFMEFMEAMECDDVDGDDIDVDKSTNIIRNDGVETDSNGNMDDNNISMEAIDLITRYIVLNRIVHTLRNERRDIKDIITVYKGNGNSSKSSFNHRDSNNNNNNNNNNHKGNYNNNNDDGDDHDNDNNNGGSGGYGNSDDNDGDDDKNNDKNNNNKKGANMDEEDEEEKEEDELDEDAIFDVLNNMDKYDDKQLTKTLSTLSPNVLPKISKEISKLTVDIDRLYNVWNINTKQCKSQSLMRNKKRSKSIQYLQNECINTYNAPKKGNTSYTISRRLTNKIIPSLIRENISDLYSFMMKSLAMDTNNIGNDEMKIFNFDFHDKKENKILYCIAEKENKSNWKMKDAVFTKNKIMDTFNIQSNKLPKSIADQHDLHVVSDDIDGISQTLMKRKYKIIQNTAWCDIPIYKRTNNKRKVTLSLTKEEFIKDCRNYIQKQDKINPIPIIMFNNNGKYQIEYIWIVRINENNDIGISFEYDLTSKDKIKISGIHLDQQYLISAHELISTQHCNKCHCFDNFKSYITDINIGNVCLYQNKIKDLQKRLNDEKTKNKMTFIELKYLRNERIKLKQEISELQQKCDKFVFTDNKKAKCMNNKHTFFKSSKRRNSLSLSTKSKSMSISDSTSIQTSPSIIFNSPYQSLNQSLNTSPSLTPITPQSIQQMPLLQNINITQNIKVIPNNNISSVRT